MRIDTKKRKLAAMLGIEFKEPPTKAELSEQATISREAEGVIAFGNRSQKFIQRECVQCGGIFAVNRSNISCCSDTCRVHYCLAKYGLVFNPKGRTPEDRWSEQTGGPEPLIVSPAVLPLILNHTPELPKTIESPPQSLDELLAGLSDIGVV